MIKKLALSILLVGSSGVALAAPATGDITAHRGFLSFVGSFFNDPKEAKREIITERGFKVEQKPTTEQKPNGEPKPLSFVPQTPAAAAAPEIDPASAMSGLTLLVGGIIVTAASRRRNLTQA